MKPGTGAKAEAEARQSPSGWGRTWRAMAGDHYPGADSYPTPKGSSDRKATWQKATRQARLTLDLSASPALLALSRVPIGDSSLFQLG